ncbi:MAG TPA: glycosyltransferase family 4 protein [Actinomycetota bacterium]|nr:glycosyltransferase family 4 protein [Actinomycetota bacterium]
MRILVLHSTYSSGPMSGENRIVADEAQLLRAAGHSVTVWDPVARAQGAAAAAAAGARAVWSIDAVRRVRALIDAHHPDVVHCHNLFPELSPAVLRTADESPWLMNLQNFRLHCLPATFLRAGRPCEACLGKVPWRGVVYRCYRGSALASAALATSLTVHRTLRSFDRISMFLPASTFMAGKFIQAGMEAGRLRVKSNFCWPAERRRGPGDYFLFLGRVTHEKGLDTLLKAWRPSFGRLVVAGDGPQMPELQRPDHVSFLGQVPPGRVADLISGARALCVPSRWYEGAPRVITEAYAAGVPVIGSRIGSIPEFIDGGVTGSLVDTDEVEQWTQALAELNRDETSMRLGEGALSAWSTRFSPEAGLADLEDCYRQARLVRQAV